MKELLSLCPEELHCPVLLETLLQTDLGRFVDSKSRAAAAVTEVLLRRRRWRRRQLFNKNGHTLG